MAQLGYQLTVATILDQSPWDSTAIFIFFGSLLKQCILFEIFLQLSLPQPYTKLKLGKKFWIHASNIVCGVGWGGGGGLDLCELENALETQKCPKTFVYDCS